MQSRFAGSGMLPMLHAVRLFEKELWLAKRRVLRVLGVDPGVITGACVLWIDADTGEIIGWAETLITHDEVQQTWDLMALLRTLADCGRVWVVIEDFTVDQVNMSPEFLSPVRIGRRFEFGIECMRGGELGVGPVFGRIETVTFQSRSRKADYQDARLKKMGFFTPGPDHRRDATRHALVQWKRLKNQLPLPAGEKTSVPAFWEPALAEMDLVPKKFGRSFNGKPTGSHGAPAPAAVTREDMKRFAGERQKHNERGQNVPDKRFNEGDKRFNWVPLSGGKAGWVREHDPKTQSGLAPRRAEADEKVAKKANVAPQMRDLAASPARKRRAPKRLV